MPPIRRAKLRDALAARAQAALDTARAAHAAAMEGATHAEARPENDKDTRGLEQSYLARGLAARVAELEGAVSAIGLLPEAPAGAGAQLGAVVTAEDDDGKVARYFLAPWGGGELLPGEVTVVTPSSPIGRALLGRDVDDEVEIQRPGGARTLTITAIA
ncbi:MAG TPA: GreA/GreB family elongation factor [Kofleriaceae bacterium]|nr:GreA/GreB family elongation factor [Kofleriaceae bacterium]